MPWRHPCGLVDRLFGRRAGRPESGANIEVELTIPLERVHTGGEEDVSSSCREICAACKGNGAKEGTALHDCPTCADLWRTESILLTDAELGTTLQGGNAHRDRCR